MSENYFEDFEEIEDIDDVLPKENKSSSTKVNKTPANLHEKAESFVEFVEEPLSEDEKKGSSLEIPEKPRFSVEEVEKSSESHEYNNDFESEDGETPQNLKKTPSKPSKTPINREKPVENPAKSPENSRFSQENVDIKEKFRTFSWKIVKLSVFRVVAVLNHHISRFSEESPLKSPASKILEENRVYLKLIRDFHQIISKEVSRNAAKMQRNTDFLHENSWKTLDADLLNNEKVLLSLREEARRLENRKETVKKPGFLGDLKANCEELRGKLKETRQKLNKLSLETQKDGKTLDLFENSAQKPENIAKCQEFEDELALLQAKRASLLAKTEEIRRLSQENRRKREEIAEIYAKTLAEARNLGVFPEKSAFSAKYRAIVKKKAEILKEIEFLKLREGKFVAIAQKERQDLVAVLEEIAAKREKIAKGLELQQEIIEEMREKGCFDKELLGKVEKLRDFGGFALLGDRFFKRFDGKTHNNSVLQQSRRKLLGNLSFLSIKNEDFKENQGNLQRNREEVSEMLENLQANDGGKPVSQGNFKEFLKKQQISLKKEEVKPSFFAKSSNFLENSQKNEDFTRNTGNSQGNFAKKPENIKETPIKPEGKPEKSEKPADFPLKTFNFSRNKQTTAPLKLENSPNLNEKPAKSSEITEELPENIEKTPEIVEKSTNFPIKTFNFSKNRNITAPLQKSEDEGKKVAISQEKPENTAKNPSKTRNIFENTEKSLEIPEKMLQIPEITEKTGEKTGKTEEIGQKPVEIPKISLKTAKKIQDPYEIRENYEENDAFSLKKDSKKGLSMNFSKKSSDFLNKNNDFFEDFDF